MKNNKGFAITSTIYGFLILFLIILLSVLSVMRSQNNRSIIISDKISKNAFINIADGDEITVDPQVSNNFSMVTSRGKYYARIMKGTTVAEDCYFYAPDDSSMILESGVVKINNNVITLYKDGSTFINSGITEVFVTKYYVEK